MSKLDDRTSPSQRSLDSDELTVKAEYFVPIQPKEENLRHLKNELRLIFRQEGLRHVDHELNPLGPSHRSMTFRFQYSKPKPPMIWKVKNWLGISTEDDLQSYHQGHYFERLEEHRDDLPFEIDLRFRAVEIEDSDGYKVKAIAIPTLLQKYKQGVLTEDIDVDTKTTVSNTKREIDRVFDKIEAYSLRQPHTASDLMDSRIDDNQRKALNETNYGRSAVGYFDEAESCFQHNNLRAALNCYILGIEWVIIAYLDQARERDVIGEETENGGGYGYMNLVDILEGDKQVSQKTIDRLKSMNYAERRWIAHHKSGAVTKTEVSNVKERLEILIDELYP